MIDAICSTRRVRVDSKDRKSTRLNSSHEWISYAVFCLKKKAGDLAISDSLTVAGAGSVDLGPSLQPCVHLVDLQSFPTRRSSDLDGVDAVFDFLKLGRGFGGMCRQNDRRDLLDSAG